MEDTAYIPNNTVNLGKQEYTPTFLKGTGFFL